MLELWLIFSHAIQMTYHCTGIFLIYIYMFFICLFVHSFIGKSVVLLRLHQCQFSNMEHKVATLLLRIFGLILLRRISTGATFEICFNLFLNAYNCKWIFYEYIKIKLKIKTIRNVKKVTFDLFQSPVNSSSWLASKMYDFIDLTEI